MFRTYKLRQIWYDMRHQSVVTWVTLAGTALSIFLLMLTVTVQQIGVMPFAPESNRPRLLYGQNIHISSDNSDASSQMSYQTARTLYGNLEGVERTACLSFWLIETTLQGTTREMVIALQRKCDADFWKVFDHRLVAGRYYTPEEVDADAHVAVITESMAKRLFGDIDPIGHELTVNHIPYKVTGIVADHSSLAQQASGDIFTPLCHKVNHRDFMGDNRFGEVTMALLLDEGADPADIRRQVEANYAVLNTELAAENKRAIYHGAPYDVETVNSSFYGSDTTPDLSGTRRERLITYAILLLLPAINLASMLHSRLRRRVSEFGIRRAFGCTSGRLIREILGENFMVTIAGGIIGWICSIIFISSYAGLFNLTYAFITDAYTSPAVGMLLNWRLILSALTICFILNIISASIPAWQASRLKAIDAINGRTK
ncbi:MAG: ABC transporter permease [Muribaculaceae bacterium]|nr:ABC transporter permease [Muribaculaceae bacterium]MDE6331306.1 ABC transporter permease [Muribaculaceae bacterium]